MRLLPRKPAQSLNKAYARQSISQDRMDTFRRALARLFARIDENETEDYQKNSLADFLNEVFYHSDRPTGAGDARFPAGTSRPADLYEISIRERIDIVVHRGSSGSDPANKSMPGMDLPGVIIEVRKAFAGEMMTTIKNNVKALHELILDYFEERERHQTTAISQLIITDVYNWFIFDENDFRHHFYDNPKLQKLYQIKQQQKKDNSFFYGEAAKILRELDDEVPVTCLDLRKIADALTLPADEGNRLLMPAYKLFSPEHLLKLPFVSDTNTLNRQFYNELLYIVGLHETSDGRPSSRGPSSPGYQRIQRLPEGERHDGSLVENTINRLRVTNALANLDTPDQYGRSEAEQLFSVGLELCITWLNRILFLKLLEGQLVRYHQGDWSVQFLTARHIREFDELNELFFEVLAVPEASRPVGIVNRYDRSRPGAVPYLNSSLFEPTDLERTVLTIKELKRLPELPLFNQTALKDRHGNSQTGQLPTLQYLLAFLDAYDFSPEGPAGVLSDNKPLISAAGLGLVFEKLNGSREGSFLTPGLMPTYLVRDAIRKAAVNRFNERFGWQCADVTDISNRLGDISLTDANEVVNALRIVDPAVGSGHFLVSALNELIALKADLGILADREGRRLRHYDVSIVDDQLVITDKEGEPVQYRVGLVDGSEQPSDIQRVQETIFVEKQTLIENCLFGVDISSISVNICRLRLWVELLKSVYYKQHDALDVVSDKRKKTGSISTPRSSHLTHHVVTLPNLDINIKAGNSLVSRFATTFRVDGLRNQSMRETFLSAFQRYSVDVMAYKHVRQKTGKDHIRARIRQFQELVQQMALVELKEYAEIRQLEVKLTQASQTFDFFAEDERLQRLSNQLDNKKQAFQAKQRVFNQAFEWRFEFPEVLDESGSYVGFDVVVGHPPSIRQQELGEYKAQFRNAFPNSYTSTADLYVLFIEQGLNLLRPGGQLAYILPNKWMRAGYGAKLRQWLKTKAIEQITDFGDSPEYDKTMKDLSVLAIRNTDATGTLQQLIF